MVNNIKTFMNSDRILNAEYINDKILFICLNKNMVLLVFGKKIQLSLDNS